MQSIASAQTNIRVNQPQAPGLPGNVRRQPTHPEPAEPVAASVEVKEHRSGPGDQAWRLVHDGQRVLALVGPGGTVTTGAGNTLLVGTKEELDVEIARLGLTNP